MNFDPKVGLSKYFEDKDAVVMQDADTGDPVTLRQLFKRKGVVDVNKLDVDALGMQSDASMWRK